MSYIVDSFEVSGLTVEIHPDEDAESPRSWDNVGTMVCWHRNYNLGDEQPHTDMGEWLESLALDLDPSLEDRLAIYDYETPVYRSIRRKFQGHNKFGRVQRLMGREVADRMVGSIRRRLIREAIDKNAILLPLYLYEHGGITMRVSPFSDPWDSGQVGYIYVSHAKAIEEFGDNWQERAKAYLISEVETYDDYLTGSVYGYVVKCPICEDVLDSCWGFYGLDYCKQEARSATEGAACESCKAEREEAKRERALTVAGIKRLSARIKTAPRSQRSMLAHFTA